MKGLGLAVYTDGFNDGIELAYNIVKYFDTHPNASDEEIASELECEIYIVQKIRKLKRAKEV